MHHLGRVCVIISEIIISVGFRSYVGPMSGLGCTLRSMCVAGAVDRTSGLCSNVAGKSVVVATEEG